MVYNGLPETFVATATAALEWGAMPYAKGIVDNHFRFYVREDGMAWHRRESLPASARALTILSLFHWYSADDGSFALQFFDKARAIAELLIARHASSLRYGANDARYGIPSGEDDALHSDVSLTSLMLNEAEPGHWYASAAESYRAFREMGAVWTSVGKRMQRADVVSHGVLLLQLAPQLYKQLHVSLNRTATAVGADICWALTAESRQPALPSFRGYAEMFYSGALSKRQVGEIYAAASGSACGVRTLTMGSPALANGTAISTPTAHGLAYGLLQHEMVEPFLLHYFAVSAHSYTRGTFTTPESASVTDRNVPTRAYSAAGQVLAPIYLKWMLCFEHPETHTVWLAKATPRDWLRPAEAPLVASNVTTRYGRLSFSLRVASAAPYSVHASVTLPESLSSSPPAGGLRLRIRAPLEHAGKLSAVTLGGQAWAGFSAAEETVDILASQLTTRLIREGLPRIVATFAEPPRAEPEVR